MKGHINILTLFDYAQDKITDEEKINEITDHIGDCSFCRRVLSSHLHLLENPDESINELFPKMTPEMLKEFIGVIQQVTLPAIFQKLASSLTEFGKIVGDTGAEIIGEVRQMLEDIKAIPGYETKVIPVIGETYGQQEQETAESGLLNYFKPDIAVRISLPESFDVNDFMIEFYITSLYIIYDKLNYTELVNRKVKLFTVLWNPFIFETTFIEDTENNFVVASFNVGKEDVFPISELSKEKDLDDIFFLSIYD